MLSYVCTPHAADRGLSAMGGPVQPPAAHRQPRIGSESEPSFMLGSEVTVGTDTENLPNQKAKQGHFAPPGMALHGAFEGATE